MTCKRRRRFTHSVCAPAPVVGMCLGMSRTPTTSADDAKEGEPAELAFFTDAILPILKTHCYECQSHEEDESNDGLMLVSRRGWEQGGDSGPAVAPGKPDESLLIQAVQYSNPDLEMPPTGKLPDEKIVLL